MALEVESQHIVYGGIDARVHVILYVAKEQHWRHADLSVLASATSYPPAGDPAAFAIASTSQHVVYSGTDSHIHMLVYKSGTNGWSHTDLSKEASTGFPTFGKPAAYAIGDESQHIVFRGTDSHIHMFWYDGNWHHHDLTNEASASGFPPAGDLASFAMSSTSQHVVYRGGADSHIHMLYYDGHWHHADLNKKANATGFFAVGDPAAYGVPSNDQRVFYRDIDGHIHTLYFTGDWHHKDLTSEASASDFPAIGDPAAYRIAGKSQHVVYRGAWGHIHMLVFKSDTGAWSHHDLSVEASADAFPAQSNPAAYAIADESQHAVYRGTDGHIHMLVYKSNTNLWSHHDLSIEASAPVLAVGDPARYVFKGEENGGFWGDLWDDFWNGVKGAVNTARDGFSFLWELGGWLLTPVGFLLKFILIFPVFGGLIRWLLNLATAIVFGIGGFVFEGILCGIFGVCLPKRIRVCVVMFTMQGEPLATESDLSKLLQKTKQIFKDEANIEIVSSFTIHKGAAGTRAMDPPCGPLGFLEDAAGVMGLQYQAAAMVSCVRWGTASIVGIGSPIYAFGVRNVQGDENGCSLGPLSNYVVFEAESDCTTHLAHEIGHACGLILLWGHQDDPNNLMHKACTANRGKLTGWQKVIVRGSKYATYW